MPDVSNCLYIGNEGTPIAVLSLTVKVTHDRMDVPTTPYDDPSRFPARIKAAATALFAEGLQGEFQVHAENDKLKIVRK